MISIVFFETGKELEGFEISGHSGAAQAGSDIVCSAVSSAALMAANTLTEVVKLKADVKVEEGYLFFKVSQIQKAQDILRGLQLHLNELCSQYPKNITVEVK